MNWRHLMIAAVLLPGVPVYAANDRATEQRAQAQLEDAFRLGQAKDSKGCVKKVRAVIGASGFSRLNDQFRGYTYYIAAICSLDANDLDASRESAVQATLVGNGTPEMWRLRGGLEMENEAQPVAAMTGLEAMAARAPDALNALPPRWVYQFYNRIKKGSDFALRRRALELFAAKTYDPVEVGGSTDYFRSELATLRAAEGNVIGFGGHGVC
jgi:hypothetical protein